MPATAVGVLFALPAVVPKDAHADVISLAAILACAALGLNIILGYLGRLSLGHHAFFGVGAFTSALLTGQRVGLPFALGVLAAVAAGAAAGALVGLLAARRRTGGVAVATLAFAAVAEATLFRVGPLAKGVAAQRPAVLDDARAYAYLCLVVLAVLFALDWRLLRSKAGRALAAVRDDERVAASFGIPATAYTVLAMLLSGAVAAGAGALLAHLVGGVSGEEHFGFPLGLLFVAVTVVGGVGNRVGVVLAAAGITVVAELLGPLGAATLLTPGPEAAVVAFVAAVLLLLVLVRLPGGIGQVLAPVLRWVRGERFDVRAAEDATSWGGGPRGRPRAW